MKDHNKKLSKLPVEVKKHVINGTYQFFSLEDQTYPQAAFLLVTEKEDKFLLSWEGEVVKHYAGYTPPKSAKISPENPFPEMNYKAVVAG